MQGTYPPTFVITTPPSPVPPPSTSHLDLALEHVANHLTTSKMGRLPQRGQIEGGRETICEAEEQHGRDPAAGVLKREAAIGHLVLLGVAAVKVVDAAGRVHLGLVLAGGVGGLGAGQDVEVVVGGVAASVSLGANGCTCGVMVRIHQ